MQEIYRKIEVGPKEKKLELLKKPLTGSWIRVTSPTTIELTEISKKYDLDKTILTDMIDEDSVPVIEKDVEKGYVYSILRIPFKYSTTEIVTIPLGIIFLTHEKIVLTICKEKSGPINNLIDKMPAVFKTDKKSIFFSTIIRFVLSAYMRELNKIESEIKEAEKSVKGSLENKEIVALLSHQKTLVYFKTSIIGNKKILSKVAMGRIVPMSGENKELLEDALIDIDEAQQLVAIYDQIIKNTIDAYSSIVSNNLNVIMKFLALITIALSIPTMVASFYGMNVPIPFQNSQEMFYLSLGLSVLLSIGVILFFKYKKWM
jgi:magnesium transporter